MISTSGTVWLAECDGPSRVGFIFVLFSYDGNETDSFWNTILTEQTEKTEKSRACLHLVPGGICTVK